MKMIWSLKTQPLTSLAAQGTDSAHVTGQSATSARHSETAATGTTPGDEASRRLLLRVVQPGLAGLMDGSVSTLAPIFATAFATHQSFTAFLVGIAAALGAGISMAFSEALSDDGALTGRGNPIVRGGITGAMTFLGGSLHTLPFPSSSRTWTWRGFQPTWWSASNWLSSRLFVTVSSARGGGFRHCKWLVEECWSLLLPGFSEMLDASRRERRIHS